MSYFLQFQRFSAAVLILVLSLSFTNYSAAQSASSAGQSPGAVHIEYHFPMDGSIYVPTNSSIIIRPNVTIDPSLLSTAITVSGSMSGMHSGAVLRSDDRRTLVFSPNEPFKQGEKVTVTVNSSFASEGVSFNLISFSFITSPSEHSPAENDGFPIAGYGSNFVNMSVDTVVPPAGFPQMQVTHGNNAAPGYIFLTTFADTTVPGTPYRAIIDSMGRIMYVSALSNTLDWDFKVLPNGRVAFCEGGYSSANGAIIVPSTKYYIMDSDFNIVDTFNATSVSPYTTDFHDIEILPNGHALMLCQYTLDNYDMSVDVKKGGQKKATFVTNAVIEVDRSINKAVWVWRCWDPGHYSDTDATNDPLTESTIDAVHANAVFIDTTDGNLLLSARSMDEITKINRADTGSIMWRLGGKHNQFTFINDSIKFSHQHAIRRIPNGHYTLFDNGNFGHNITRPDTTILDPGDTIFDMLTVKYSRACEYDIDTAKMTANLVWHYDRDSTMQSMAMGYVQRFDNGNTLINWGLNIGPAALTDQPAVTEVDSNGKLAFELHINTPYVVYRAEKFPWNFAHSSVASGASIPNNLLLGQPFPNPANGSSRIVFSTPAYEPVQLQLYDALGRMVRTYFDGPSGTPITPLELETKGLPDGSYQLVLRGSSGVATRQLIVLE